MTLIVALVLVCMGAALAALLAPALRHHVSRRRAERASWRHRVADAAVPWWHTGRATGVVVDVSALLLLACLAVALSMRTGPAHWLALSFGAGAVVLMAAAEFSRHWRA